jgi:hypothetical protein
MDIEEIDGSFFSNTEPTNWKLVFSKTSTDKQRLCRAYTVPGGTIRVLFLTSTSGAPQWIGNWWGESISRSSSLVGTEEDAREMAESFLAG